MTLDIDLISLIYDRNLRNKKNRRRRVAHPLASPKLVFNHLEIFRRSQAGRLESRQVQPAGVLGRLDPGAAHVAVAAVDGDQRGCERQHQHHRGFRALPAAGD